MVFCCDLRNGGWKVVGLQGLLSDRKASSVSIATHFVQGCHLDLVLLLCSTVAAHCLLSFVKIVQVFP